MKKRAHRIAMKGEVTNRHLADEVLKAPGEAVLVRRGVLRSMVMACPDGCGEVLTVNLDGRTGKAWRYYERGDEVSVFPSVWRDTGCKSHFILWRSRIYWCDWNEELDVPMAEVISQVEGSLSDQFQSYTTVADRLDFVPWAVLSACSRLRRDGRAVEGDGRLRGHFKRVLKANRG
jgi:hypothetical protein